MGGLGTSEWWQTDRDVKRVCVAMLFALVCGFIVVAFSIDTTATRPRTDTPNARPATAAGATAGAAAPERIRVSYAERDAMRWSALLWAGACFAVGSFIGFIFGIPRSLSSDTARTSVPGRAEPDRAIPKKADAQPSQIPPANIPVDKPDQAHHPRDTLSALVQQAVSHQAISNGRGPSTAVNTNLEQISDWLTKIIVGVSLVNSEKIGNAILRAAGKMADSIGGGPDRESLALAILVYFSVIGLLGGYLPTRLFLQRAFDTAGFKETDRT